MPSLQMRSSMTPSAERQCSRANSNLPISVLFLKREDVAISHNIFSFLSNYILATNIHLYLFTFHIPLPKSSIRNKTSTEKRGRSNLYHRLSLSSPSSTTMLANIFYTSKAQACICANVDGLVSSAVEMTAKISCFVHYLIKCY